MKFKLISAIIKYITFVHKIFKFMSWVYLVIGGLFEAVFAFSLSRISVTTGKTMIFWIASFIISVSISMFMLYKAIDNGINVSVGYAVWAGLGAVFTVLAGIIILKEPVSLLKIFLLCTLILSIVGLNLISHK